MAWLDPGEDILRLLRGTLGQGSLPLPPRSEAVFDLVLLIVICGMLLVILIAGPMYLWHRVVEAQRLKRRSGVAARNLLSAPSKRSQK
jgi:hypothetical protein